MLQFVPNDVSTKWLSSSSETYLTDREGRVAAPGADAAIAAICGVAAALMIDVLADELDIGRNAASAAAAAAAAAEAGSSYGAGAGASAAAAYGALGACLAANEALLHRAVLRRPLGVLKYAMTLDGKIATNMGHSAWVSSAQSRAQVFETRARSDAVIVGGNTVRRDNPRLTTRREGGHTPARIVMSRTLDLPE
ncbi:Riboflavin biosynthesis protein RibD, partial [Tetrabaena socialis]